MDARTRRLEDLLRRVRENAGRTDRALASSPEIAESLGEANSEEQDSPVSLGWSALLGDIPPPAPLPLIESADDADDAPVQSFPSDPPPTSAPPRSFVVDDLVESAATREVIPATDDIHAARGIHAASVANVGVPTISEAPRRLPTEMDARRAADHLAPPGSAIERAVRVALLARSDSEPPTLWKELALHPRRASLPPIETAEPSPTLGANAPTIVTLANDPSSTSAARTSEEMRPSRGKRARKPRREARMSSTDEAPPIHPVPAGTRTRTSPLGIAFAAVLAGTTFAMALRILAPSPTLAQHVLSANLAACVPPLISVIPSPRPPRPAPVATPSATPTQLPLPPDAKILRPDEGFLLISPPPQKASLKVFVQGVAAGDAGAWLRLPCGARFVRVAERLETAWGSSFPSWVEAGTTIVIPCRSHAVVHMDASPPPR